MTLSLKATGSIVLGAWAGSGSPDGIEGYTSYSEVSDLKHGSLIANIGIDKDGYFSIGSYKVFTAQKSGDLRLMVNDADPSNNSGSFIVEYGINKEIKPF